MSEKVAVYPGSFNPVHPGHLHVIRQAAEVFDEVIVLVAENPEKTYKVPAEVRAHWIDEMTTGFQWKKNIVIDISSKSLVDICRFIAQNLIIFALCTFKFKVRSITNIIRF